MMTRLLSFFILFTSTTVLAASPSPGPLMTYEGVLTDASGTPITTSQTVTFQVIYGSTCIVFEEAQSIAPGTNGEFSAIIGAGTRADSTGNTADRIFASTGTVTCKDGSTANMVGFATRSLHIKVGSTDLTPDVTIGNIPMAINSQKLADKGPSDFLQVNGSATQANMEAVLARTTEISSLLNNVAGNTLAANTANSATTATNFTGSLNGDVTGTMTSTSVTRVRGVGVSATAPTSGQVLKFDGTNWTPMADNTGSAGVASVTVSAPLVNSGTTTAPVLSLSTAGTAGTYFKVTTDSYGRVTTGSASLSATDIPNLDWSKITTTPTTLSGYGISDGVKNGGSTPSIQSGIDSGKPGAGTVGRVYISTDTKQIYRDTGSTWDLIGSATGSGGTITAVLPGTGLTGGGSSGNVTLNANVGTAANQLVQLNSSSQLPAVDGSLLTNLQTSALTGLLPTTKGGTGASTFNANSLLITNGTGSAFQTFTCALNEVLSFNVSGIATCNSLNSLGAIVNGGNTFAAPMVVGTKDSNGLTLMANNVNAMTITPAGNVGINTTAASSKLEVVNGEIRIRRDDDYANIQITGAGSSFYPAVALLRTRGTLAAPTATQNGDVMGAMWMMDGTYQVGKAGLAAIATETHTSAANGMSLNFYTVQNTTNTATQRMVINHDGNVGIGVASPTIPLVVGAAGSAFADGHFAVQDTANSVSTVAAKAYISGRDNSMNPIWMLGDTSTTSKIVSLNAYDSSYGLSLGTNNTSRMYIDPSGSVGVGTTVPNIGGLGTTLTVSGGGTTIADTGYLELNNPISSVSAGTFGGKISFMASNNSGNKVLSQILVGSEGSGGTNGFGGKIIFSVKGDNVTTLNNAIVINNLGYVGMGVASPTYPLSVSGDIMTTTCIRTSAGIASGTCTSDERTKTDVKSFDLGLDALMGLNPKMYRYNGLGGQPESHQLEVGVIAQDVEKTAPELIVPKKMKLHPTDTEATEIKQVNYSTFTYILINSVKELYAKLLGHDQALQEKDAQIQNLRSQTEKLNNENAAIKSYLCSKDPEAVFCKQANSDQ
ncbi:MAG: tail fiber domain-containing protein [Bdellovibrio sp.]|nr:tail fiber domain-containing protein [Bdellovibrio sp.]